MIQLSAFNFLFNSTVSKKSSLVSVGNPTMLFALILIPDSFAILNAFITCSLETNLLSNFLLNSSFPCSTPMLRPSHPTPFNFFIFSRLIVSGLD